MFWKTRAWKKTISCAVKNIILYVSTVFAWKKFESIHRYLCPMGCMPWIILRLFWIFMCQGCRTQRWQNHWVPLLCFHSIWIYLRLLQVIFQNILITWLVLWETSAFCSLISQRFWGNNMNNVIVSLGSFFFMTETVLTPQVLHPLPPIVIITMITIYFDFHLLNCIVQG